MAATSKRAAKATKAAPAAAKASTTSTSKAAASTSKSSTRAGGAKASAKASLAKKSGTTAKKATASTKVTRGGAAKKASGTKAAKKAPAKKPVAKKQPAKKPAAPSTNRRGLVARPTSVKPAPRRRKGPLDKFLLGQLAALEAERVTYTNQAASLRAEADLLVAEREPGDVQFDEESGEGDTLAVERERDLALSAQATAAVDEIDIAIAKIHDGTYGVCEQCNSTIPKERLRALPYAAVCVQCKSAGFTRR